MENFTKDRQNASEYIIDNNKELVKKYDHIVIEIKELEHNYEKLEEENDSNEKKIIYLRGLLINEYTMRKKIYEVFASMEKDRLKLISSFNRYVFFKNLLFVIVLASCPMAWTIKIMSNVDVFNTYLTLTAILCLIYFIFLPDFVFESSVENKLSNNTRKLKNEYKEHVKNTCYLEELANNC